MWFARVFCRVRNLNDYEISSAAYLRYTILNYLYLLYIIYNLHMRCIYITSHNLYPSFIWIYLYSVYARKWVRAAAYSKWWPSFAYKSVRLLAQLYTHTVVVNHLGPEIQNVVILLDEICDKIFIWRKFYFIYGERYESSWLW